MRRILCALLTLALLCALLPCVSAAPADLGAVVRNMPTGQKLFITLYNGGVSPYRWNVSGVGAINSDMHLYDATGENCSFRLTHVENEWYGIKFIQDNGTDRYIDVADKSKAEGKVLHIWEASDDKLAGNAHRQFAFYSAGKDAAGNPLYYIKLRHSGMWVGTQNNAVGSEVKLVQTANAARKWYVTPSTVPTNGKEAKPWTQSNGLYCELFARNMMQSVSVKGREGNLETDGMGLNLYNIGQSSRWLLTYNSTYNAYEIASTQYKTQEGLSLTGKVWDVSGEKAGTDVNIWSRQSKAQNENTSQLWRFVPNSDGSYKIYNVRTGKYVCIRDSVLTQGEAANAQAFVLSYLSTDALLGYGNVFELQNEDMNWMASLPDTVLLSEINMPATHDTGANAVIQDMNSILDNASVTKCQKHYFEEQLATGVRSFDVRCNAKASNASVHDVMIVHGGEHFQCYNRKGLALSLGEILDISKLFLQKHPSESVVILLKPDAGTHADLARTLAKYIKENAELFWQSDSIPTLRQARGKIVLLRRFEDSTGNKTFGPDLTKWDDQDYGSKKGLLTMPQASGAKVYVQDAYQQTGENKINYVQGAMNDSQAVPKNAYIYNYTSCTLGFVIDTTRVVNAWLYKQNLQGKRLGMVMLNYSDSAMCRKIYRSNVFTGPFMDNELQFGHSLTLENDISINFLGKGEQLKLYDSFYLECKVPVYNGNERLGTETVNIEPVFNGTNYEFTLTGITAKMMNDEIEAVFRLTKDGQEYYSKTDIYSVAEYAYGKLDSTKAADTAELKAVCANLLRYGAMAQTQFNYRTDALVDAKMTEAQKAYLTDLEVVEMVDYRKQLSDHDAPTVPWKSTTLELGNKVIMCLIANLANYTGDVSDLTMRLSFTDNNGAVITEERPLEVYNAETKLYAVSYDGLRATEMRSIVRATVYEGETRVSKTVEYSIESYGARSTDPSVRQLCLAMLAYGDSANTFFNQ